MANDLLTIGEAATMLGVSRWTVREMEKRGEITPLRARRGKVLWRFYSREDVERLREERRPKAS